MSVLASLTAANVERFNAENLARLNGVPFGKWEDLQSELPDDSSIRSSQLQSDASDNSSNASEASVNSRFDPDLVDEDYSYSRLDSLKSKTRRLIRSDTLPSTCKKCTLLACALIGAGIAFGVIYNNFNSNKSFFACAEEGFDSGSKDWVWILRNIDNYSNWPVFKYCQNSLKAYIKDLGG